jgi:patatin-like phospholipase/acyl hydrolase
VELGWPAEHIEALVPVSLYDPLNPPTLVERVRARLPKRILSIDDGADGAFIALEFLEEMERRLQIRYGEPGLVLSDYFDLIGGVGTGALIATNLALGQTVANAKEAYGYLSRAMISKKSTLWSRLKHMYDPAPLKQALRSIYGDIDLRSPGFKTCMILVATRLDTGQVIHFTNFMPEAQEGDHNTLHLSDLLYGCVTPPTYLPPLEITLSSGEEALLQDGCFSVGQNPSLYLFLVATSPAFELRWRTGERWLQLFSIGTGRKKARKLFKGPANVASYRWLLT